MNRSSSAPLASKLIRKVFPVYLAFAVAVTLMQIAIEYRDTHAAVLRELDSTARAFEPAVADALWNYQFYLLPELAEVILSAGAVTGVDIGDAGKLYVTHAAGETHFGALSKHVQVFHADGDGTRKPIGYITLYSGHDVVIERVQLGVALILAAATIKTAGLWLIIVFFVNRLLAGPLRRFTEQIGSIDPTHATEAPHIDIGPAPSTELAYLRDTFTDLADRALESRRLAVQKETAEAASVAKSRFLAAASHDLRQPMHAMNLYLGTLARFELPPSAREMLSKARASGEKMDEMFRALLDLSRLDAGVIEPQIGVFPIAPLLERLCAQFEPEARAKKLDFRVVTSAAYVSTDIGMVERIASNFIANAVRYTKQGGILVGCRRRAGRLRLAVYDTGPGIAEDKQRAVFEEFYQIDRSARARGGGMGLGLAIVERLAKLLSAPITLISHPKRGSMFAVDIPRYEDAVLSAASGADAGADDVYPSGLLVVVIDDDETILDATRALLEQWQCRVVTAASCAEALAQLTAGPEVPDVLICDHRLSESESGITAIQTLRSEFNCEIPALVVTGDTSRDSIHEIAALGVAILHKPVSEDALRRALLRLIQDRIALSR